MREMLTQINAINSNNSLLSSRNYKILLIDDDPDEYYLTRKILSRDPRNFYDIVHAIDLQDAANHKESDFDIALLDLGLGKTEGVETLKSYNEQFTKLPVVVITGNQDLSIGEAAIRLGASDFIPKSELNSSILSRAIIYSLERESMIQQLEKKAFTDQLTGLANRESLFNQANALINHIERNPSTLALALLDLDGFKQVNDIYGHKAGDEVLVEIAQRLMNNLRSADIAARIGGDEFIWILSGFEGQRELLTVVQRKLDYLNEPLEVENSLSPSKKLIGASIGIAIWKPGVTLDELMRKADEAMYESKARGKNCITFNTEHS